MSESTSESSEVTNSRSLVLPRNVKLLSAASLLNDIASEMVYPLIPKFLLDTLGGSRFLLGTMEGLADSLASLLKIQFGTWSDRARGRKPFVVFGYLVAAIARPLHAGVTAASQLLLVRLFDRFGKGVRTAARDALIADSSPPSVRGRAFGFHRAMDHLGAALGPLLATLFLLAWPGQLRLMFLLTAIPGAMVVMLLWFGLREPKRHATVAEKEGPPSSRLEKNFVRFLVAMVVFTLGNSSDAFLLVRAEEVGVPGTYLPLLWCVFHIAKSLGNLFAGSWVDRWGPRFMLGVGWAFYAAIYLAFAFATTRGQVIALFLAYAAYYALTEPAEKTMVGMLVPQSRSGAGYGWFHGAIGLAAFPSSLIFGWFYERWGHPAAFAWGAIQAALATALLFAVQLPHAKVNDTDTDRATLAER